MCGQWALPPYRKLPQVFDFARNAAYNAVKALPFRPDFIGFLELDSKIAVQFPINRPKLSGPSLTLLNHYGVTGLLNPIHFIENVG